MNYKIKWTKVWLICASKKFQWNKKKLFKTIDFFEKEYQVKVEIWKNFFLWIQWVDPRKRALDLNNFLEDDNIKLIMNYSDWRFSNEIVPYINYEKLKKSKKVFIWFWDSTILNNLIYSQIKLKSFSWLNFCDFENKLIKSTTKKYFDEIFVYGKKLINFENIEIFKNIKDLEKKYINDWWIKVLKHWKSDWYLVWWHLTSFVSLFWTKFCPTIRWKILLIEENNEWTNEDARSQMFQISQQKWFNKIKWVIVWKFTSKSISENLDIQKTILDVFWDLKIPIIMNIWYWYVLPRQVVSIWAMCYIDTYESVFYFRL